jgi:Flp pilus assembly protein TadG
MQTINVPVLSGKSIAIEGIVEQRGRMQQCIGEERMNGQTDLREPANALECRSIRAVASREPGVERRPAGRQFHPLLRLGEQGQSLVEFALLLPILLLLTTGIFVFGLAMNNYMQLTNAVSVGARTVAINAGIATDPCATAVNAIEAAAPGLAASGLSFKISFIGTTATVNATGATCPADAASLTSGSTVMVTATYPLNLSVYGKVFNLSHAVLTASSTELVQ